MRYILKVSLSEKKSIPKKYLFCVIIRAKSYDTYMNILAFNIINVHKIINLTKRKYSFQNNPQVN